MQRSGVNPAVFDIDEINVLFRFCVIAKHEGPHVPLGKICKMSRYAWQTAHADHQRLLARLKETHVITTAQWAKSRENAERGTHAKHSTLKKGCRNTTNKGRGPCNLKYTFLM